MYTPQNEFIDLYHSGDEHHCCGCASKGQSAEEARFPDACKTEILCIVDKDSPSRGWPGDGVMGLRYEQFFAQFHRACETWNTHVGLRLAVTDDRSLFPRAICKVVFWDFGGSVLADSHLADGTCADDKRQRYDHRQWSEHLLYLTILHELGHLIGLQHKTGPYIMNPTILTGLDGLTDDDIRRARGLGYGDPLGNVPSPPPTPTPPAPQPPAPPSPLPPESPMDWMKLIELLLPLVLECMARDGKEAVANRLHNGGPLVALRVYRALRSQGLAIREARSQTNSVMAELAATPPADLVDLFATAEEING